MGILSGNPKEEPMHYGEIFDVWAFSTASKNMVAIYQAFLNHAGDEDLRQLIRDLIEQAQLEIKECDALLHENGIAPAPTPPSKPKAKLEDIPAGARLTDPEIAAAVAADLALGLVACSQIIGKCIREDIAALFAKYHNTKLSMSTRALKMSKQKGWLVPPPLQIKRPVGKPEPVNV
jgi:transcriptional regulator of met regulon